MKKYLVILIAILLVSMIQIQPASAQYFGVNWSSGFQVINLDPSNIANILIYYYSEDGTLASGFTNPVSDTIAVNESNNYYPIHALSGFHGSVVISSDVPISVIANVVVATPNSGQGSYVGFDTGASSVKFPLVMKSNANQTSVVTIQNVGSTEAEVTFSFVPQVGTDYPAVSDISVNIVAQGSYSLDLNAHVSFATISRWIGSVTASVTDTANDSIAGVVNTINNKSASGFGIATYNGFTGTGSSTVILPLIQENNNGNRTGISCQNLGSTSTIINVAYTPSTGFPAKASESSPTAVPQNGIAIFIQDYTNIPGIPRFLGSATVTNTENQPLVCVVNQQKPSIGSYSTYSGFDPASASDTVVFPLVMSRNGNPTTGYTYTAFSIASADGSEVTVTCDFKPGPGYSDVANQVQTNETVIFDQSDIYGTGAKYIGGAVCTASDGKGIFGILNQSRLPPYNLPRDLLSSYNGFNN